MPSSRRRIAPWPATSITCRCYGTRCIGPSPKKKSTLVQENDIRAFVASRDGVPVGRIASVVNHAHLAKYNDATGHFGLLQGIDDRQLFTALLDRAAEDLRAKGMRRRK